MISIGILIIENYGINKTIFCMKNHSNKQIGVYFTVKNLCNKTSLNTGLQKLVTVFFIYLFLLLLSTSRVQKNI